MNASRMIAQCILGSALALALSGCASSVGSLPQLQRAESRDYVIGPGDKVQVQVFGLDGYNNQTFAVENNGTLSLPLLGRFPAEGLTFSQLETNISDALKDREILKAPMVQVQPAALRPFYILGEVNKPGAYDYVPGISVVGAISKAGGYTFRANENVVIITRTMNGKSIDAKADGQALVLPGDQIKVIERWF